MNEVKICETTISKTRPLIEVPIEIIAKVGDDFLMNVEIDYNADRVLYYDFTDGSTSSYSMRSEFSKREAIIVEEAITIENPKI